MRSVFFAWIARFRERTFNCLSRTRTQLWTASDANYDYSLWTNAEARFAIREGACAPRSFFAMEIISFLALDHNAIGC